MEKRTFDPIRVEHLFRYNDLQTCILSGIKPVKRVFLYINTTNQLTCQFHPLRIIKDGILNLGKPTT